MYDKAIGAVKQKKDEQQINYYKNTKQKYLHIDINNNQKTNYMLYFTYYMYIYREIEIKMGA